ncbi:MAG: Bacterial alpha-L-rhamnosidase [Chitinivibrionales bacterium]|nr:Bacterial alpha-L-rhamnosidase [Chitinivibrionales bacterium]
MRRPVSTDLNVTSQHKRGESIQMTFASSSAERVLIASPPSGLVAPDTETAAPWVEQGAWVAQWIACPRQRRGAPFVAGYRCGFALTAADTIRVHVSADERYELFLDGHRIGRGPLRGYPSRWPYETYDLRLAAGAHMLAARVWTLGPLKPWAQTSIAPGFILAPESPELTAIIGTGTASWETKELPGYSFESAAGQIGSAVGAGPAVRIDGRRIDWAFPVGDSDGWQAPSVGAPGNSGDVLQSLRVRHLMVPSTLPAMLERPRRWGGEVRHIDDAVADGGPGEPVRGDNDLGDEHAAWQALLVSTGSVTVPAHTMRRIVLDIGEYVCVYPRLTVSGGHGAEVAVSWAEALTDDAAHVEAKGNRDDIEGRFLVGIRDTFVCDGGAHRTFEPHWWRAGRYAVLEMRTAEAPVVIEAFEFVETGYRLSVQARWDTPDPDLSPLFAICERSLRMCMHETYMDCPYYEQLMYAGDTRLQALLTYALSLDDRLPRRALTLFDQSRRNYSWLPTSSAPSGSGQLIPPFALWWVGMVHDYALWRGDKGFVTSFMPAVRDVLERFMLHRRPHDGLIGCPPGWCFVDRASNLLEGRGVPVGGVIGALSWQVVLALVLASRIEEWLGEGELASRDRRLARELTASLEQLWDEKRGAYADDRAGEHFSEHSQCLALLSGMLSDSRARQVRQALFGDKGLVRSSIYFSHYLFECYAVAGQGDLFLERLQPWLALPNQGFRTTPEHFGPTRSDCHAWGAHPLYHYFCSVLGVRPEGMAFERVAIRPMQGGIVKAGGDMPHPRGMIRIRLEQNGQRLRGEVNLPDGVTGTLYWGDERVAIAGGTSMRINMG